MVDFIGVGAQKSGTSWIYACLYEHPEICAPIKDIHYFSRDKYNKGKEWYENHFRNCTSSQKKGEFSTSYLYSENAASRIKMDYADAKIIAVLRNPVDRAYSQYRNAIKAGEIIPDKTFSSYVKEDKSVIGQGLYYRQLSHYFKLFARDKILILIYEDIEKDPEFFMSSLYRFLGVNETYKPSMLYTRVNIARKPKVIKVDTYMHKVSEFLRRNGFDKMVHLIRRTGIPDLVRSFNTTKDGVIENSDDIRTKQLLRERFRDDVLKLNTYLGTDMTKIWKI